MFKLSPHSNTSSTNIFGVWYDYLYIYRVSQKKRTFRTVLLHRPPNPPASIHILAGWIWIFTRKIWMEAGGLGGAAQFWKCVFWDTLYFSPIVFDKLFFDLFQTLLWRLPVFLPATFSGFILCTVIYFMQLFNLMFVICICFCSWICVWAFSALLNSHFKFGSLTGGWCIVMHFDPVAKNFMHFFKKNSAFCLYLNTFHSKSFFSDSTFRWPVVCDLYLCVF